MAQGWFVGEAARRGRLDGSMRAAEPEATAERLVRAAAPDGGAEQGPDGSADSKNMEEYLLSIQLSFSDNVGELENIEAWVLIGKDRCRYSRKRAAKWCEKRCPPKGTDRDSSHKVRDSSCEGGWEEEAELDQVSIRA